MVRPIINSEKRIVQTSLTQVTAGNVANVTLAIAKQDPLATSPQDVKVGTSIKAIFVEYWFIGSAAQPPTVTATISKIPGGVPVPDALQMQDLNGWNNKKNILKTTQGFVGDSNTNPVPLFREWIKIPKGKQRFGISDRIVLSVKAIVTDDVEFCGVAVFKAYN